MFAQKMRAMWHDREGVSPVIGVILMVAVTVVLAAVIGAFVFGMGDSLNDPAPNTQVAFDYDSSNSNLAITHDGGETINADNTYELRVNGEGGAAWSATVDPSGGISAGDTIASNNYGSTADVDNTVEVVWVSPDEGSSQVIGTWEKP